jgi:hypothetical protein
MQITMKDGQVIVSLPKAVLVLTRAEFIEALRRGKQYRRREAMQGRLAEGGTSQARGCETVIKKT